MTSTTRSIPPAIQTILQQYHGSVPAKAWWEILSAFLPFFLSWGLMVWSLQFPYWVTLLFAIVPSAFLLRIFSIQHDCGHYSFFASKRANDTLGIICSILTLTPYHYWLRSHAYHHAHVSNLDFQDTGYVKLLSVQDFQQLPPLQQLLYRIYRNPLILFVLGPPVQFLILQRLTVRLSPSWHKERRWVHITNALILLTAILVSLWIGWRSFLLVELPIVAFTSCLGVWLFYVQHTYEDSYFSHDVGWDWYQASVTGSSLYDLPVLLHFFTGNTGFHHIHHLDPLIPNYSLRNCYRDNPSLQIAHKISLWDSFKSIPLALWDEQTQKMVKLT
ncbi:MAG: fatty acid desaturase family protein [Prochlorotrichaceae cyanobacterium]|jgi:omega-6 fatty acid desaturase (delta-12 desaturase)